MKSVNKLIVTYHSRSVGTLSMNLIIGYAHFSMIESGWLMGFLSLRLTCL